MEELSQDDLFLLKIMEGELQLNNSVEAQKRSSKWMQEPFLEVSHITVMPCMGFWRRKKPRGLYPKGR